MRFQQVQGPPPSFMQMRFINNQPESGIGEDIAVIHNFTTHSNYHQVLFSLTRFLEAIGYDPALIHSTILVDPDQLENPEVMEEDVAVVGSRGGEPIEPDVPSYDEMMERIQSQKNIEVAVKDDQKLTNFIQQINDSHDFAQKVFKIFMEAIV